MSRLQLLRISTANLLVLVLIVFFLKGRPPLAESVHLIRPGMSFEQVKELLGTPTILDEKEYFGSGVANHTERDGKVVSDYAEYRYVPFLLRMDTPTIGIVTPHRGLPSYRFSIPLADVEHPDQDPDTQTFWLDRTSCLWLVQKKDGSVIKVTLVPLEVEPVVFTEWMKWLWRKAKASVTR